MIKFTGDWRLRLALYTPSGTCQKWWWWCWNIQVFTVVSVNNNDKTTGKKYKMMQMWRHCHYMNVNKPFIS